MEDEEEEEIVAEEEAKIIYPYDEVDPNNRPPPASDDESEFAPSVIPVFDAKNKPVASVIHFSSQSIRSRAPTIGNTMTRIRKLNDQMGERAEVNKRIVKRIDKNTLRVRMFGRDTMNLDGAFHIGGGFVKTSTHSFLGPFPNDPYVQARNAAMANNDVENDDVEGDDVEDEDDMDDDAADPSDP
ncbi:hypothetical protein Tco_1011811 [Tanacetum coccineum]